MGAPPGFALMDRAAVAAMIGMTLKRFYRRYPVLRRLARNPFPPPAQGNQRGARWDPRAILRWVDAGGEHGCDGMGIARPEGTTEMEGNSETAGGRNWMAELDRRAADLCADGEGGAAAGPEGQHRWRR